MSGVDLHTTVPNTHTGISVSLILPPPPKKVGRLPGPLHLPENPPKNELLQELPTPFFLPLRWLRDKSDITSKKAETATGWTSSNPDFKVTFSRHCESSSKVGIVSVSPVQACRVLNCVLAQYPNLFMAPIRGGKNNQTWVCSN